MTALMVVKWLLSPASHSNPVAPRNSVSYHHANYYAGISDALAEPLFDVDIAPGFHGIATRFHLRRCGEGADVLTIKRKPFTFARSSACKLRKMDVAQGCGCQAAVSGF